LELGDEIFEQRSVDEFRMLGARHPDERPHQHAVDLLGEDEAHDKGDGERDKRLDQARAQLNEMLDQRRLGGVDVFLGHARDPSCLGAGVASAKSLLAGVGSGEAGSTGSGVGAGGGDSSLAGAATLCSMLGDGGTGGASAAGVAGGVALASVLVFGLSSKAP